MSGKAEIREWLAGATGVVALDGPESIEAYENAIGAYERTGDKAALHSALLALGIAANAIRWHAENPGEYMICVY